MLVSILPMFYGVALGVAAVAAVLIIAYAVFNLLDAVNVADLFNFSSIAVVAAVVVAVASLVFKFTICDFIFTNRSNVSLRPGTTDDE